jgi:hypothetical protein
MDRYTKLMDWKATLLLGCYFFPKLIIDEMQFQSKFQQDFCKNYQCSKIYVDMHKM